MFIFIVIMCAGNQRPLIRIIDVMPVAANAWLPPYYIG